MYEHVKTGSKHIPPSEQPLQFQSGYFLNKPLILMASSNQAILPLSSPMREVLQSVSDLCSLYSGFSCVASRYMLTALLTGVHRYTGTEKLPR